MTTMLTKGANAPLAVSSLRAELTWRGGPGVPDVDASALLVDGGRRVRGDADLVFYNQPGHPSGAVSHLGKEGGRDSMGLDLARMEGEVDTVVLAASADGGTFGQVPGLVLTLYDASSETPVVGFEIPDAGSETAFVFGEIYRRSGGWKFRAVGQGYASGLAGLATDFGISVASDAPAVAPAAPAPSFAPPPAPASPVPAPPAPASPVPAPAADSGAGAPVSLKKRKLVSMEKRLADEGHPELLSLTKKAAISLDKHGLGEHTARVVLCLDISASMGSLYRSGKVQALAERILSLGLRFDDNGQVDVCLFGTGAHDAGGIDLGNYRGWTDAMRERYPLESGTDYARAMAMVREHSFGSAQPRQAPLPAEPGRAPVYVMFLTDGMPSNRDAARAQVQASSYEPLFWQFVAIGRSSRSVDAPQPKTKRKQRRSFSAWMNGDFQFLEELDTMSGRLLDNAGFFAVQDPANLTDDQLYELLMEEYPRWLEQAHGAGLLS